MLDPIIRMFLVSLVVAACAKSGIPSARSSDSALDDEREGAPVEHILLEANESALSYDLPDPATMTGKELKITKVGVSIFPITVQGFLKNGKPLTLTFPEENVTLSASKRGWILINQEISPFIFRVVHNAGQKIFPQTETPILFNEITGESYGTFDTETGKFKVPADGWYQISAQASFTVESNQGDRWIVLKLNDELFAYGEVESVNHHGGAIPQLNLTVPLNRDDEIYVVAYQNSEQTLHLSSDNLQTFLQISRVANIRH